MPDVKVLHILSYKNSSTAEHDHRRICCHILYIVKSDMTHKGEKKTQLFQADTF